MSILDLIETDGGTLKRAAMTNGGEWAGPCPWCGGNDRFRVWPEEDGGRYWCRGCGKAGDSIQWLRERRGLSFVEACRVLEREPGPKSSVPRPAATAREPKEATAPPAQWQERARAFLDEAVSCLWSEQGQPMREWLHDEKGLQDETIRAVGLGLTLADMFEPRASWGLDPSLKEDGTDRRQWLPAGLVIPQIVDGAVHRLRIRRTDPGDGDRYIVASGSSMAPMILTFGQGGVVVVESEIDAILLWQEVGDLAGVVALGNAQTKPDKATQEVLSRAARILISLDGDEAGAKAAWRFWLATYGQAKRWPSINGKDASDARINGLDLRSWVIAGVFGTEEKFERFCIQTVDGGLSDSEALTP